MVVKRTFTGRLVDWLLRHEHQDEDKAILHNHIERQAEKTRIQKERIARREQRMNAFRTIATYRYNYNVASLVKLQAIFELRENGYHERKIVLASRIRRGEGTHFWAHTGEDDPRKVFFATHQYTDVILPWLEGLKTNEDLKAYASTNKSLTVHI